MKKRNPLTIFIVLLILAACNPTTKSEIPSDVSLLIEVRNYDHIAYEIFVSNVKQCSIPADYFGYFVMSVYLENTYQLEIKNAGFLYDAISFTPSRDAAKMQPGWVHYGEAEYFLGIGIRDRKLYFRD